MMSLQGDYIAQSHRRNIHRPDHTVLCVKLYHCVPLIKGFPLNPVWLPWYVLGVPGKIGCSWRITDSLRHHEWTCQLTVMTVMMVQGSLLVQAWDEWVC